MLNKLAWIAIIVSYAVSAWWTLQMAWFSVLPNMDNEYYKQKAVNAFIVFSFFTSALLSFAVWRLFSKQNRKK